MCVKLSFYEKKCSMKYYRSWFWSKRVTTIEFIVVITITNKQFGYWQRTISKNNFLYQKQYDFLKNI